ncbi:MAG: hypothetical protein MUC58_09650 [Rhizobiaceae bacterium]|jgi:hypothetical protein|nr:hypothetical protein [Rhizobiaceae bacterium]
MLTGAQIEAGVRRGIITPLQRDALLALPHDGGVIDEADGTPDEQLRLVGGGNDLFVTIGALMFIFGAGFALTPLVGEDSPSLSAILAGGVWALAEIVTRQKRMRLSSTVLAAVFLGLVAALIAHGAQRVIDLESVRDNPLAIAAMRGDIGWISFAAAGTFLAACFVYFQRFRVPVIAALAALAATALAFTQTALFLYDGVTTGDVAIPTLDQLPDVLRQALYIPLACGIVVFGIAVALDLNDRERRTIWSDCAFWLHVVSAPLLVHPLFIMATGQDVAFGAIKPGTDAVIGLAVLIALFTLVALIIDRRSLLVPTLAYFGSLGLANLVDETALSAGINPLALVLIAVGGLIILFGAGWQRIRRVVIRVLVPDAFARRLPPVTA